jgi:hypothetical protein
MTSHPIQYQVPLWRALKKSGRIPFQVWYLTDHGVNVSKDVDFGESFAWDMDMLSGYEHRFLDVATDWDLKRFRGVRLRERLADRVRKERVRSLWVEGWRFQVFWDAVRLGNCCGVPVWLRGDSGYSHSAMKFAATGQSRLTHFVFSFAESSLERRGR